MNLSRATGEFRSMHEVFNLNEYRRAFVIAHNGLEGSLFVFMDWLTAMWDAFATENGCSLDRKGGAFVTWCNNHHRAFLIWLNHEAAKENCYRMNLAEPS